MENAMTKWAKMQREGNSAVMIWGRMKDTGMALQNNREYYQMTKPHMTWAGRWIMWSDPFPISVTWSTNHIRTSATFKRALVSKLSHTSHPRLRPLIPLVDNTSRYHRANRPSCVRSKTSYSNDSFQSATSKRCTKSLWPQFLDQNSLVANMRPFFE